MSRKPSSFDYDLSIFADRPLVCNSEPLNYVYVTTAAQLDECRRALWDVRRIGLDIETTGYVPDAQGNYPKKVDPSEGCIRLIQIAIEEPTPRQWVIDCFAVDPTPVLERAWATASRPFVSGKQETAIHYAWFEQEWLGYHYGLKLGKIFDTCAITRKVNSKRISGEKLENAKLATVARGYLQVDMDKGPQSSDWRVEELSQEQILYAALDAAVLLDLIPVLKEKIVENGLEDEVNAQMQKFWGTGHYLGRKHSPASTRALAKLTRSVNGDKHFEEVADIARQLGRAKLHFEDRVRAKEFLLQKQEECLRTGRFTVYDPRELELLVEAVPF